MERGKKPEPPLIISKQPSDPFQVVPKENIGRWDEYEHKLFLEGLQKYGNDWKQIANMISTRNLVQVRTHAQKYFQKLNKNSNTKSLNKEFRKLKEAVKPVLQETSTPTESPVSDQTVGSPVTSIPVIQIAIPARDSRIDYAVSSYPSSSNSSYQSEYVLSEYQQRSNFNYSFYDSIYDFDCTLLDDLDCINVMDLKTPVF